MVHIVLIRPGSTDYDLQGRIQGTLDIPLSDQGRGEVQRAVESLRSQTLSAIYCAPCEAAEQTAEIIGDALHVKVKPIENLRNLDQGLWQGMRVDEVKTKQPKVYRQWQEHPENVCPPDGEMLAGACARIDEAIEKLLKRHRAGAIGLVVPEPLATVLAARLKGGELGDLWKTHGGCTCCQEFDVHPTMWRSEVSVIGQAHGSAESNGK
jgi:broad specificity phosphatase PhoE